MPELERIHERPAPNDESLAKREEKSLFEREEREKRHLHFAFIGAIWLAISLLGAMAITLVCNWILPDSCHWLKDSETENLRLVLGSALGGGVLTKLIERKLKGK